MAPKLSAIWNYPVKACMGVGVPAVTLDARGPVGDRRFMIVDSDGMFITQRSVAKMALIRAELSATRLTLHAPAMPTLSLPLEAADAGRRDVQVWRSQLSAASMGPHAYQWLSDFLGMAAELVRMDERTMRIANPEYAPPETQVSFADGYPILLISEASLDDLNAKLVEPIPMNRFRPNLVISGTDAFDEDSWDSVRIGGVTLDIVKPCDRCTVTTIDQRTGIAGKEPLKTLATYRRRDNKTYFGQNVVHRGLGTLRVGDEVEVLGTRCPSPDLRDD